MRRTEIRPKIHVGVLTLGTLNVRTLAHKGTNGIDHNSNTVLQLCTISECDVVGLQEMWRANQGTKTDAGYAVVWRGVRAGMKGKKGVHGVWLTI